MKEGTQSCKNYILMSILKVVVRLLKKKTKFGPYQYYEITDKGRRYLQINPEIEDNLRPVVST